MTVPPGTGHLSEEVLAAWVDGGLTADERARAAAHLVDCDDCRALVLETRALTRTSQRRRWVPRLAMGGLAAAAVALLVVAPDLDLIPGNEAVTRTTVANPAGEDVRYFAAVGPADRALVHPDTTSLRWEQLAEGTTYEVIVNNNRGDILLRTETRDTLLALGASPAPWQPGETYTWVVYARLPSLGSARTHRQSFQVATP